VEITETATRVKRSSIKAHLREKVLKEFTGDKISLAEVLSFRKTIFEYKSDSHRAKDYLAPFREIIEKV
jgi:cellulose biosynthesis protein BcsQ